MKSFIKGMVVLLGLSLGMIGTTTLAQNQNGEGVELTDSEKAGRIAAILTDGLETSRLPEIYADLRRATAELYIPYAQQMLEQEEFRELDPKAPERIAALVTFLEYSLRAANELDPVLDDRGEEIIGDMSALLARTMTPEQIRIAEEWLETPAARKVSNIVYAISRLYTNYSFEEIQRSHDMMEWMKDLDFKSGSNPFTDKNAPPPPPERVAKAEAVVADLIRVSRIEEMVREIIDFTRNVVLKVEALKPAEREKIRDGLQKFEFFYNLGKGMSVAVAPSALATALNDEQLAKLHDLVLSPIMAKGFRLVHEMVREGTSFTKQDFEQMRAFAERAEQTHEPLSSQERREIEREWQQLAERWGNRLRAELSPETRAGLDNAIATLEALSDDTGDEVPAQQPEHLPPGQREL